MLPRMPHGGDASPFLRMRPRQCPLCSREQRAAMVRRIYDGHRSLDRVKWIAIWFSLSPSLFLSLTRSRTLPPLPHPSLLDTAMRIRHGHEYFSRRPLHSSSRDWLGRTPCIRETARQSRIGESHMWRLVGAAYFIQNHGPRIAPIGKILENK